MAEGGTAGGSLSLAELIDEHGAALIADFRACYGVWLWQALREVPPRILLALVEELPDNGSLAASLQGGREFHGWGVDRHMTANIWDLLAQVNTDPKKKAPTHPRPKDKDAPPTGALPFRALIGRNL